MGPLRYHVSRADPQSSTMTPTVQHLLVALVVLSAIAIILTIGLFILRRVQRSRRINPRNKSVSELPFYESEKGQSRNSRRLTISTVASSKHDSMFSLHEKEMLVESPPESPVPEIRITFPEEVDEQGKAQSGKVVVVRVGDNGIGLEPVQDLPSYQQHDGERFQSLDLERIGGLKEKEFR